MPYRRRKPRPKTKPYTAESQYEAAYLDLLTHDGRKRGNGSRRDSADRIVVRLSDVAWIVKGGFCEHQVMRQDGRLLCMDHEPAHKRVEGYACCHELAVYKKLAWDHIPVLFTPEGLKRSPEWQRNSAT